MCIRLEIPTIIIHYIDFTYLSDFGFYPRRLTTNQLEMSEFRMFHSIFLAMSCTIPRPHLVHNSADFQFLPTEGSPEGVMCCLAGLESPEKIWIWIGAFSWGEYSFWVVVSFFLNIFTPTWGDDPIWLIFFKLGWNHQVAFQRVDWINDFRFNQHVSCKSGWAARDRFGSGSRFRTWEFPTFAKHGVRQKFDQTQMF